MKDNAMRIGYLLFLIIVLAVFTILTTQIASADIAEVIRCTAAQEGVDPELALAIARVESGLNVGARGKLGEIGVYQLRPEFHRVRCGDYLSNVRTGIRYLRSIQVTCSRKYGQAWFICYNVGPNYGKQIRYPTKFPYYTRVLATMKNQRTLVPAKQGRCEDTLRAYEQTMSNQNYLIAEQAEEIEELKSINFGLRESLREAHEIYLKVKRKCISGL